MRVVRVFKGCQCRRKEQTWLLYMTATDTNQTKAVDRYSPLRNLL